MQHPSGSYPSSVRTATAGRWDLWALQPWPQQWWQRSGLQAACGCSGCWGWGRHSGPPARLGICIWGAGELWGWKEQGGRRGQKLLGYSHATLPSTFSIRILLTIAASSFCLPMRVWLLPFPLPQSQEEEPEREKWVWPIPGILAEVSGNGWDRPWTPPPSPLDRIPTTFWIFIECLLFAYQWDKRFIWITSTDLYIALIFEGTIRIPILWKSKPKIYQMLLLFNEGLSLVKNDIPIQAMKPPCKACPLPKKVFLPSKKLFHSLTLSMVSSTPPSYDWFLLTQNDLINIRHYSHAVLRTEPHTVNSYFIKNNLVLSMI